MALRKSTREALKRAARRSASLFPKPKGQKVTLVDWLQKRPTTEVGQHTLARRLQAVGIDPATIHIPPPIAEVEGGVLPPPTPPTEANVGFFERLRRR